MCATVLNLVNMPLLSFHILMLNGVNVGDYTHLLTFTATVSVSVVTGFHWPMAKSTKQPPQFLLHALIKFDCANSLALS